MSTKNEVRPHLPFLTAALMVAAAALSWQPMYASAEEPCRPSAQVSGYSTELGMEELEQLFWSCDYAGTTRLVDANEAVACVAVTEELKNRIFGGDFDALVAWWEENKPTQHALRDAQIRRTRAALP